MSRPEMDDVDRKFLDSLVPEDGMALGFVCGVVYLDSEGLRCWRMYDQLEGSLTETLGVLELMKLEVIGRCPSVVKYLGFEPR